MIPKAGIAGILMGVCAAFSAHADQSHPKLDELFAELANPGLEPPQARTIEREIWALWGQSGSPTIDLLMARAKQLDEGGDELPQAFALFDAVIALAPDFAEGWNKRATAHYLNDDYQNALKDIERTLALEPRHFGALSGLGMILQELGKESRALQAFRMALDINPHLPDITEEARLLEQTVEGQGI